MDKCKIISIDGVDYVRRDQVQAIKSEGLDYCIVRTYSAGVFAGYLKNFENKCGVMVNSRRLWQ